MPSAASSRLARRVRLVLSLSAAREAYGAILEETPMIDLARRVEGPPRSGGPLAVLRRLDAAVADGHDLLFAECHRQGVTPADDPPARVEPAEGLDLLLVTFENRTILLDGEGNFARVVK